MELLQRHITENNWITLTIGGCILLLTIAKWFFPKRFNQFTLLPVTNKYFKIQGKDDTLTHPFNILLFIVQSISLSLFTFICIQSFYPEVVLKNEWLFVQLYTCFFVGIIAKILFEKIIGAVFSIESIIDQYVYQKLSYRNYISFFLLICCILFSYKFTLSPAITWTIILLSVLFNAISLFYSYSEFRKVIFSHYFYFIVYICTLEISPYIILYKVVS